jgi:hypothetical protein
LAGSKNFLNKFLGMGLGCYSIINAIKKTVKLNLATYKTDNIIYKYKWRITVFSSKISVVLFYFLIKQL